MKNKINKLIKTAEDCEVIETVKLSVLRDENGNPFYVNKDIYDSMEDTRESARQLGKHMKEMMEPAINVETEETYQYMLERLQRFK